MTVHAGDAAVTVWSLRALLLASSILAPATGLAAEFAIGNGQTLTLSTDFSHAGQSTLNASNGFGSSAVLYIGPTIGTGLTLSGTGRISMSQGVNNSGFPGNSIQGAAGAPIETLTNAAGHTIEGVGQIGAGSLFLVNQGLIDANNPTGANVNAPLLLDPAAGAGNSNTGIMQSSNGGRLILRTATFDNTGGTIQAVGTNGGLQSLVDFDDNTTVTGGTIRTVGDGTIRLGGATINGTIVNSAVGTVQTIVNGGGGTTSTIGGLTNAAGGKVVIGPSGSIVNTGAAILQFQGGNGHGYTNDGSMLIDGRGQGATLRLLGGDVTLGGSGTLTLGNTAALNDPQNANILGDSATAGAERLTNGPGHTIQGFGAIGLFGNGGGERLALTNQGSILGNVNGRALTLDLATDATSFNAGMIQAATGGAVRLQGGYTLDNTGGTIASGAGSNIVLTGDVTVRGGGITGPGLTLIATDQRATLGGGLTVAAGAELSLQASSSFATTLRGFGGDGIVNNGTISMHADGSGGFGSHEQALQVATGSGGAKTFTLDGTGVLSLSDSAVNFIRGATGTEAFVNGAGHTIQGAGNIGQDSLAVTNDGTIRSIFAGGNALSIAANGTGFTNNGALRAEAGSAIVVQNDLTNFAGTSLTGGTYSAAGTIKINEVGAGQIATNAASIILDGANGVLTNNSNADALAGLIGNSGSFAIINGKQHGTTGALANAGTVDVGIGSGLKLGATGAAAYVQSAGLTKVNGTLDVGTATIGGGVLQGSGTVAGNLVLDGGSVNPGNSPGTLTVTGDYSQAAGGKLNIEIASLSSFDKLVVEGDAFLHGTAEFDFDFAPVDDASFVFLTTGATDGFSSFFDVFTVIGLDDAQYDWHLSYGNDFVRLDIDRLNAPPPTGVPEPSGLALLGIGLAGLWSLRRQRVIIA